MYTPQHLLAAPSQGHTPLYTMATEGELEPMKLLLEAKANVEASDNDGRKPSLGGKKVAKEEHGDRVNVVS